MRARYMFRGKSSPPRNGSSMPCSPNIPSTWRAPKRKTAEFEEFYQPLKRNYLLTSNKITLNIILLKMNEDL